MNKFQQDLLVGQTAEDVVADILKNRYSITVTKNNSTSYNTLKEYDLLLDNSVKVEVKHDLMATQTKNLALEIECNKKPSGITASKASLWIYLIDETIYIFKLKDLIDEVQKGTYHRIVYGGDGGRARLALFNLNQITKLATKIKWK